MSHQNNRFWKCNGICLVPTQESMSVHLWWKDMVASSRFFHTLPKTNFSCFHFLLLQDYSLAAKIVQNFLQNRHASWSLVAQIIFIWYCLQDLSWGLAYVWKDTRTCQQDCKTAKCAVLISLWEAGECIKGRHMKFRGLFIIEIRIRTAKV